jgi:hypothetical protein
MIFLSIGTGRLPAGEQTFIIGLMLKLLKNLYLKTELIKGKKLIYLLVAIFIIFTATGLLFGYFINKALRINEATNIVQTPEQTVAVPEEKMYQGMVKYIDVRTYPEDEITYILTDGAGKEIILLKASDQKLTIVENLNVKLYGTVTKTKDGTKDILKVERISIQNGTN